MPHLTVRGIEKNELKKIAPDLKQVIVDASSVNPEYVKIFHSPVERVDSLDEIAMDIYWMPRPQDMCDRVAQGLTNYMQKIGKGFVQVTFTEFPGSHFYENGTHY